jgi:hypothetical protein
MNYLVILFLLGAFGIAVVLIILAWQNDYQEHGRQTGTNCAITLAFIAGAIVVFLGIAYLITGIGD